MYSIVRHCMVNSINIFKKQIKFQVPFCNIVYIKIINILTMLNFVLNLCIDLVKNCMLNYEH